MSSQSITALTMCPPLLQARSLRAQYLEKAEGQVRATLEALLLCHRHLHSTRTGVRWEGVGLIHCDCSYVVVVVVVVVVVNVVVVAQFNQAQEKCSSGDTTEGKEKEEGEREEGKEEGGREEGKGEGEREEGKEEGDTFSAAAEEEEEERVMEAPQSQDEGPGQREGGESGILQQWSATDVEALCMVRTAVYSERVHISVVYCVY